MHVVFKFGFLLDWVTSPISPILDASSLAGVDQQKLPILAAVVIILIGTTAKVYMQLSKILPPMIYNRIIIRMTKVWYGCVLERLRDGDKLLDVGIGTAGLFPFLWQYSCSSFIFYCQDNCLNHLFLFYHSLLLGALLKNHELVRVKQLLVIGIDCNSSYIKLAKSEIRKHHLEHQVRVANMSVYDGSAMRKLVRGKGSGGVESKGDKFDCAYFSGSLALLPNPVEAILSVASVVKPGGKICITQTYQNENFICSTCNWLLYRLKPRIKWFTTIDFGRLLTTSDIIKIYGDTGLKMLEHIIIPSSVDNIFQSAYLTILEVPDP